MFTGGCLFVLLTTTCIFIFLQARAKATVLDSSVPRQFDLLWKTPDSGKSVQSGEGSAVNGVEKTLVEKKGARAAQVQRRSPGRQRSGAHGVTSEGCRKVSLPRKKVRRLFGTPLCCLAGRWGTGCGL